MIEALARDNVEKYFCDGLLAPPAIIGVHIFQVFLNIPLGGLYHGEARSVLTRHRLGARSVERDKEVLPNFDAI